MLIPYKRSLHHFPWMTYVIMGLNTAIFLLTILISNFYLPIDRLAGQAQLKVILEDKQALRTEFRALIQKVAQDRNVPTNLSDEQVDDILNNQLSDPQRRIIAKVLASRQAQNAQGYQRLWQIQNVDATYVLEPHYSVLDIFAYRPSEPHWINKIIGILGSMFLHSSLMHLIGNMLFLWLFGRLLEDALGPVIYLGAYLVAGIAAVMLFHIITMAFTPQSAGVPLMGASGAIAGVMGLFAVRFYRTPLRVPPFVVGLYAMNLLAAILGRLGAWIGLALLGHFLAKGRRDKWPGVMMPAALAMSAYVLLSDVWPAVSELMTDDGGGGVAHWAHIGGYCFGAVYALAISARDEGAAEYMLDDAQKAISEGDAADALRRSQALLSGEHKAAETALPSMKAQAYEVQATAYAKQNNKEAALENYENAIVAYLADNDRASATRVFLDALEKYPLFVLPPARLLIVASHLAEKGDYEKAAENLGKIPYVYPDAPESEVATLRAARLHLEKLDNPAHAAQLLQWFVGRYPHSDWIQQAQKMLQAAEARG